ncbi:hypothetical protein [Pseudanabaena sp. ABRG5-3]|uniref:hypothetical protein n=1 Tax=Pseudanabaena sp. ABRG5-3 TaxID=685565 RepID=UPI000DC7305E|nr:hypothetical protein [Pseudanabaena sp. ABRG5-3]BBC23989.1 hypothetical protein ABRG53_1732 [Pseudanabaena sp. ABRG5-3]
MIENSVKIEFELNIDDAKFESIVSAYEGKFLSSTKWQNVDREKPCEGSYRVYRFNDEKKKRAFIDAIKKIDGVSKIDGISII